MFGFFKASAPVFSGLVWKRRFRLTPTQKYRHRFRLRAADEVVDQLVKSGVSFKALDIARCEMRETEMKPDQKYLAASKRYKYGIKPVHWVPHWTKTPFPRPPRPE